MPSSRTIPRAMIAAVVVLLGLAACVTQQAADGLIVNWATFTDAVEAGRIAAPVIIEPQQVVGELTPEAAAEDPEAPRRLVVPIVPESRPFFRRELERLDAPYVEPGAPTEQAPPANDGEAVEQVAAIGVSPSR